MAGAFLNSPGGQTIFGDNQRVSATCDAGLELGGGGAGAQGCNPEGLDFVGLVDGLKCS
jgi:hypothetical protein